MEAALLYKKQCNTKTVILEYHCAFKHLAIITSHLTCEVKHTFDIR